MAFEFTRPIRDTRDEILLVKCTGCIKNIGEMMYRAAYSSSNFRSYWLEKYPKFIDLDNKSDEEIFNSLSCFTGQEFLRLMCLTSTTYKTRGLQDNLKDYAELMSLINPYNAAVTNIELMIKSLLNMDFCKKVYFYDTAISDVMKMYLREVYASSAQKIGLLTGRLSDILEAKPEITTIFADDAGEVAELIQSEPEGSDKYSGKTFMISAIPSIEYNSKTGSTFKYQKFFSETFDRFKCETRWFQLKFVMKLNNDRVSVTPANKEENENAGH